MKYYYMINGKIMSANEKMPELRIVQHKDYNQKFEDSKFKMFYNNWLNSLQPCEISESELEKVKGVVYHLTSITISILSINNPIEVTDIVEEDWNGHCIIFKQPKQVEEIEAVKLQFFKEFGSQSFRGYPLEQCHSIWDFFKPYLTRNI